MGRFSDFAEAPDDALVQPQVEEEAPQAPSRFSRFAEQPPTQAQPSRFSQFAQPEAPPTPSRFSRFVEPVPEPIQAKPVKSSAGDIAKTLGQSVIEGLGNIGRDVTEAFIKYVQGPELKYMRTNAAAQEVARLEEKGLPTEIDPVAINAGRRVGEAIKSFTPEDWQESQARVRSESGEEGVNFFKLGTMMVADNAGNLMAGAVNPLLAFQTMFSNERGSMMGQMQEFDPVIAADYASMYASMSAPVEYIENLGRLKSAFGKKAGERGFKKAVASKLKNAGINVGEELIQDFLADVVYNQAVDAQNEKYGTNLEKREILDIDGNTITGSLAMTTVLEALGLGGKGVGKMLKRNQQKDVAADESIVKPKLNAQEHIRLNELKSKPDLSNEERGEFEQLSGRLNSDGQSKIENARLKADIHDASKVNPFAIHPKDITRETTEAELKATMDALENIYRYRPSRKQIIDAFFDPMQKQKIETGTETAEKRERQLSELEKMVAAQRKGEVTGDELLAFMEELDPEMAQEFIDRTTGEQQERPSDVIKDIIKQQKQQEVQDVDTERKPEVGTVPREQAAAEEGVQAVEDQAAGAEVVRPAEEAKVEAKPKKEVETIKPISEVKDDKVAEAGKDVLPPNPQLPFAKWYKQMMDFAVKNVQVGRTRAEFISDMEAEYLHYEATSEDLANIWNDAQIEAKRVASEVAKAEKASAKAKIKQKQFKDTETQEVKASTLIKELFRVQERASKQGRRAGINEIKQQIRDFKGSAQQLVSEMRTQMEDLKKATKLERANLKNAIKDIQLAKTPESQIKAFENAIDLLNATFESIDERTPRYEYVPFADAETETGVDKNSKYKDIRAKFIEYGGSPDVRSAKEMLRYLNGSETQAAGRFIADEVKSMKEREDREKSSPLLKTINKMHRGGKYAFIGPGRYNMFDFLGHLSRGQEDSNFGKLRRKLAETTRAAGTNMKKLQDRAAELNPNGKYTSKVMGTKVTIDTPVGKKKVSLGEIIMIDMALENEDNANAMANNDIVFDSGGKTFRVDKKQYQAMVDESLAQIDAETKQAYEKSKVLYEEIVNMSGDMVGPVANQVMKELGMEPTFKKVEGKYVPIMLTDISTGDAIEIEIPDGAGGTEVQKISDNYINREIHKGKYKERVGGAKGGRIRVGNIDSVLSHIMDTSAEFAANGIVHNDMLKLLNNKELKTQINRTFGTHFAKALQEKAYQTTGTMKSLDRTPLDKALSKAFGIVDPYRLSRPSTGLIMASSAQMVRPYLKNDESFGLGLKHGMNKFLQEKIKNDGFLYSRYSGRAFSPELTEQGAKIKTRSGGETAETRASKLISWGDKGAISTVYAATAFDEMISRGLGTTMADLQTQDEAFWEEVGNRVAYETMRTQPSGTSSAVSVWKGRARNNIVWRLLTRYGSQGSRIYNNVVDAVDEYAYNPSEENRQQLHKVLESQVITNTAILSGIKATRRSAKVAVIAAVMSLLGRPEEEIEEMKEKRDEEIDKILPSFFANFAKTQIKSVEGVDNIITMFDFITKPYVDDPFAGVMTSELRDMKKGYQSFRTAQKWHEVLESGVKETDVNGRKVMKPISAVQRRRYEENYQNAVARMLEEFGGIGLMMSRLPLAGLKDVSIVEDMIAEKVVDLTLDKKSGK